MSQRDVDRHAVILQCINREITNSHAAKLLSLTKRHVRRLKRRVEAHGAKGLIHGNRGRPSNRTIPTKERKKIIRLITKRYSDFKPTLAAEKLHELHGITRSTNTIRTVMIAEKLWKPRRPKMKQPHRSWRPRKHAYGEMQQFDGSYHDWFEGRLRNAEGVVIPEQCLLAAIDDATGQITRAEFDFDEGVFPVFTFWKAYLETHGKPRSIYLDKFSTYKMNQQVAKENHELKTQFEQAMETLHIEPITAHSPQAKGRIERLFETLQDRLVKEMRLRKIATIKEANHYLVEEFIPWFNGRFGVVPTVAANLHQPLTRLERLHLPSILSRHTKRTVRNDFTISFATQWYQLTDDQPVTVCKKDRVTIEEWVDESIHIRLRGKELNYKLLPERPKRVSKQQPWVLAKKSSPSKQQVRKRAWKPAKDHPWRRSPIKNLSKQRIH